MIEVGKIAGAGDGNIHVLSVTNFQQNEAAMEREKGGKEARLDDVAISEGSVRTYLVIRGPL